MRRKRRHGLDGVWIDFKKIYGSHGKRIEWQKEYINSLDLAKLKSLREQVREEYRKLFPDSTTCTPIGFVPSLVADPVIRRSGIKVIDIDHMWLRFAITQEIKVAEGTWEAGPTGHIETLKSPLPKSICG